MAHSLLSARVQRGTVSLTGGREVTCVKGLQAPGSSSDAALCPNPRSFSDACGAKVVPVPPWAVLTA